MRKPLTYSSLFLLFIVLMSILIVNPDMLSLLQLLNTDVLQNFKLLFIGIVLEALPFIILGVIVSSVMQVFISEKWIARLVPKNPILGIVYACLLGVLFPVCECGLIPIVRRLITKGMPLYIGVVSILVGPIVNPIVYAATYTAFRARPEMVYSRMGLALIVGSCIGLIVYYVVSSNQLKHRAASFYGDGAGTEPAHQHDRQFSRFTNTLEHAGTEFFEMGKYLMLGSFLTASIQSFVPRGDLVDIGQGAMSSHLFMLGFAYILSLCSTSDAFVAASFVHTFSAGSLLTFLVFGPMLDFKSTLMMLSVFKAKFVILLMCLVTVIVLLGALLFQHFGIVGS